MSSLVEVAKISSNEEARVAVSFLRANGVDARLANEHLKGNLGVPFGGWSIVAPSEQVARAKDLLANP